jgi:hypothetical protein
MSQRGRDAEAEARAEGGTDQDSAGRPEREKRSGADMPPHDGRAEVDSQGDPTRWEEVIAEETTASGPQA